MPDPDGEVYVDAISGAVRPRRGSRKRSHGPMSAAEKRMSRAFQHLMASLHWMDGELSDKVADEFTAMFAASKVACDRFSYQNFPDPRPEDWTALREQLSVPLREVVDEPDVYEDVRDALS